MIVEVRTYRIKEGLRDTFIDFFCSRAVPAQRASGMRILGPLVALEDENVFIWLRAFPSLEARERMKADFYGGEEWTGELEAVAMPMLENYHVSLTAMAPGFVDDLPAPRKTCP